MECRRAAAVREADRGRQALQPGRARIPKRASEGRVGVKVFTASMYGRGTIFLSPGREHPDVPGWTQTSHDDDGRTFREPIQFAVKFEGGMAEVDDTLGRYLIKRRLASARPVPLPRPPPCEASVEDLRPRYARPISVG